MKKVTLVIIALIIYFPIVSQEINPIKRTVYISLKNYIKRYKKNPTKEELLNFKIIRNDTFIPIIDNNYLKGTSVAYEFKDSIFLEHYKKIAFRAKHDSLREKARMLYWKKPIRIFFSKSINKKTKKEFLKFTKYISKNIDSLNISVVKKVENSNYIIYYKGDFDYESRMIDFKYSDYYLHWNNKSQIYKCAIKIDANNFFNENLRLYKLKELFFKTLGQFKFSNQFKCNSYFANCYSDKKEITAFDLALLKYHYSYGICKGTSLKDFETQHKRAKKALSEGGKMFFTHLD